MFEGEQEDETNLDLCAVLHIQRRNPQIKS